MTVGSPSLAWISEQYVSDMGAELFFTFRETAPLTKTSPNGASSANLTKVNASDQTMIMLESQLHIVVSNEYSSSQIVCSNTGSGTNVPINFNVGKKLIIIESGSDMLVKILELKRIQFDVMIVLNFKGVRHKIIILFHVHDIVYV